MIYADTFVGKFQTDFGNIYRHPGKLKKYSFLKIKKTT